MKTFDDKLQLNNQKIYEEIFRYSQDAIFLLDGEKIIDCNEAAIKMLHAKDKSELLHQRPVDLSPERQLDGQLSSDKAIEMITIAQQSHFHRFEWQHRRIDGEVFSCEVTLNSIHAGEKTLLYATWRDLTRQKADEQQRQFLETAIRQSPDGIATASLDGIIRSTNQAWAQMHGYSMDELPGKHLSIFHTQQQLKQEVEAFNQKVSERGSYSGEVGHVRKNGDVFPTWMTVTLVRDEKGAPIGLIGAAHDISARKIQERLLKESEIRYRTLFDLAPNAIATIDFETGNFIQFNHLAHKNLGYTRQEFGDLKISDIDIIESSTVVQQHLQKVKQQGHDIFESQHRSKEGQIRDVKVICQLVEVDGKQFNQAVWIDITKQKHADKILRQEMQRRISLAKLLEISLQGDRQQAFLHKFLAELLNQPMLKSSNQGGIFLTSKGGDELTLVAEQNLEVHLIRHCSSVSFGHCLCGRAASQGKPIYSSCSDDPRHEIQFPGMEPHGHYIIPIISDSRVLGVINLYLDAGAKYDQMDVDYLSAVADILAGALNRLDAEDKLQQHSQQLEQTISERTSELVNTAAKAEEANLAKSRFLANMSHELRTPMHAILSFSSLGRQRLNRVTLERLGGYFENINTSGNRLMLLLDDLLDLAKLESDQQAIAHAPGNLYDVVTSCVTEQMARLKENELTLEIVPPNCDSNSHFDALRMSQVISNLLGNAIKFTPAGKRIIITISRCKKKYQQTPMLRLSMRDEGIGIPEDELELVFDKFIQSSKTRSDAGGTGLGLAISKEIIEAHEGYIWAKNHPQGGAELIFEIPIT